jgi:TPR repeat protein
LIDCTEEFQQQFSGISILGLGKGAVASAGAREQPATAADACELGDLWREGTGGHRVSPRRARYWYARSALGGDRRGMNNLGACFEHGLGGVRDYARAMHWYGEAAMRGLDCAATNLAYAYLEGRGVPADPVLALWWLERAVQFGDRREQTRQNVERLRTVQDIVDRAMGRARASGAAKAGWFERRGEAHER